ncbi:MAG: hypothetical protein HYW25_03050 [Candidatus Aenigmarchaeota archaeon]|nr:hypothetical protein [Candidatus Aenigmarchaeota archaeon]
MESVREYYSVISRVFNGVAAAYKESSTAEASAREVFADRARIRLADTNLDELKEASDRADPELLVAHLGYFLLHPVRTFRAFRAIHLYGTEQN